MLLRLESLYKLNVNFLYNFIDKIQNTLHSSLDLCVAQADVPVSKLQYDRLEFDDAL